MISPFRGLSPFRGPVVASGGGPGGGGYAAVVLADAPHNYWRLGEASGSTANDETANSNGTYSGGITLGATGLLTGDSDTAVSRVQGTSGQIDCGNIAVYNSASAVTVECWVKVGGYNFQNWAAFVAKGTPFAGLPFFLGCNADDHPIFFVHYASGSPISATSSVAVWDDAPHHIVGRYDGSAVSIWVDGVKRGETSDSGVTDSDSHSVVIAPNFISSGVLGWSINGTADEVALYNFALSDARIAAHYAAGI